MRRLGLVAVAISLAWAGGAQAAALTDYSSVLVFGDSLVDSGNARTGSLLMGLPDPAPPAAGYFQGRFSNGYNFADYIAQDITGAPATAYLQGGRNYAVGGATTAFSPTETRPSFLTQLGIFGQAMQPIGSDALVIVTFGGNDIRAQIGQPTPADFSPTIAAFTAGLNQLVAAGARNIVVTGPPDIAKLPGVLAVGAAFPSIPKIAGKQSRYLNSQFSGISTMLAQSSGADITFFNLIGFQREVTNDPAAFGLADPLNVTTPCQQVPGAVAQGCDGFLYFDPIHPTSLAHAALAAGIERQLVGSVPEPSAWAMMICGFGAIGAALRRRPRGMVMPLIA